MSDTLSDADKIRNKRLAKLGGQTSTPPVTAPASNNAAGESSVNGQASIADNGETLEAAKASIPSRPSVSHSVPDSNGRSAVPSTPKISITRQAPVPESPSLKRSRPSPSPARPVDEALEDWEHRTLGNIFRLTLDESHTQDHHGQKLYFVQEVKQELEDQGQPLKLNTSLLDQAILEAASGLGKITPLEYLVGCWKRVSRHFKSLKGKHGDPKLNTITEARRLCMSYIIFSISMPDMFGREPPSINPLTQQLLVREDDERGICHDFLMEIVSRFSEDETAQEVIVEAVDDLSRQLAKLTMNEDYKPYVLALRNLVRYPSIVNAITQFPRFLPEDTSAATFEVDTLLGPFFQISPLQGPVTANYFSSPKTRDKNYIVSSQNALRLTLRAHQDDLLDITNHIIKTSKEARESMLDWFARSVNLNHKRRALQVDQKTVSSDGFMINVTVILDRLCEPFMDATFSKIDRIDVDYLRRAPRLDIREETKIDADQSTSDEFYGNAAEGTSNFISEIFFLTVSAHHYGSEAANHTLGQLEKDLRHMENQVEKLEADRPKFIANPPQLAMFERALQKYKDQIDKGLSYKHAVQGVLLDELSQTRSMQFMRYVIVWLLRMVAPGSEFPEKPLHLPLPDERSLAFRCLPEYFLEDVVGNFKFITRNMPQIITGTQSDELIMLCITFLRSSEYIKNPYLKAGLVTIMFHGIWPIYGRAKGVLGDILHGLPFATEHLLHALMKFYIEVESTGLHSQFYDKFNIRYEIFQIIKCIWSNTVYREHLSEEAKVNLEFFVRFVNLLLNDVTYVLDESLSAFVKIHDLQELLATPGNLEQTVRTEKVEALAEAQNKAKSYMQLTNETVAMLKLFTEALADSFTMPEVVQRLADMLDYNLDAMVGPRSSQLKVEEREKYGFNPRALLAEIVDVYLNLSGKDNFVMAVARDGRSYKPANFEQASKILAKYALKSREELGAWATLQEKFKKAKELDDQAEEDLGEIPDEFLDPLMFTLMEDPVILPISRTSIDRSTIRSHLLSDPNDPFNRTPLKVEDVIPDVDLKARIEAFKTERKNKKLAESGLMDISEG